MDACYQCGDPAKRLPSQGKRGVLCRGCKSTSSKARYKAKRTDIIQTTALWKLQNRDRCNQSARKKYAERKAASIAAYGGQCPCGEANIEFLVIDHIGDNGAEDRRIWKSKVSDIHTWLEKQGYPPGYQVLCGNCNLKKEICRRRTKASPTWQKSQEAKSRVMASYGPECTCCHEKDQDKLVMDHVLGGGSEEKKSYPSRNVYFFLDGKPVNRQRFQVLCHNCNQAKASLGRCPHFLSFSSSSDSSSSSSPE